MIPPFDGFFMHWLQLMNQLLRGKDRMIMVPVLVRQRTPTVLLPRAGAGPRRRQGQSLVELAIVLPVLILLIFGAIAGFQLIATHYTVAQATRAAVNQAALIGGADGNTSANPVALDGATGTIATAVRQALDTGMTTRGTNPQATIRVTCATSPCRRYQPITVTIVYPDRVWVPMGPFSNFTATASATRTSEQDGQVSQGTCGIPGAPPCP